MRCCSTVPKISVSLGYDTDEMPNNLMPHNLTTGPLDAPSISSSGSMRVPPSVEGTSSSVCCRIGCFCDKASIPSISLVHLGSLSVNLLSPFPIAFSQYKRVGIQLADLVLL